MVTTMEAMTDFIDVAVFIVILLIIWYVLKLFWVGGKKEEGGGQLGAWVSDKMKAAEAKKKIEGERKEAAAKQAEAKAVRKGKEQEVSPIKKNLHNVLTAFDHIFTHLSHGDKDEAKKQFKVVRDQLRDAIGNTRLLSAKFSGEERESLEQVIAWLQNVERDYVKEMKKKVKNVKVNTPQWNKVINGKKGVLSNIQRLKGAIGDAWKHLEQFHK